MAAMATAVPVKARSQSPTRTKRVGNSEHKDLQEFSVVFTDRAVNHMSARFQQSMRDISATLKQVYSAYSVALVPGSGTFAMEAVARQFGTKKKCLVLRNGYFSYRWSQIFEMGAIPA
jgi:aspartate aminotransferase-like enzyme